MEATQPSKLALSVENLLTVLRATGPSNSKAIWTRFNVVNRSEFNSWLYKQQHPDLLKNDFTFWCRVGAPAKVAPTSPREGSGPQDVATAHDSLAGAPDAKRPKLVASDTEELHQCRAPMSSPPLALRVKKLSEHATLPVRASAHAAGYDLFAAHDHEIEARGKALIKTDLSIAIPAGHYGRIAPRSSLAWKNHIDVGAGVIDEDYRGPLGVVLFNHASEPFTVTKGDRIAQLIIEVIAHPDLVEVDDLDSGVLVREGSGQNVVAPVNMDTDPSCCARDLSLLNLRSIANDPTFLQSLLANPEFIAATLGISPTHVKFVSPDWIPVGDPVLDDIHFNSVIAAYDSISGAHRTNQYVVLVYGGEYGAGDSPAATLLLKPWVHIFGVQATVIYHNLSLTPTQNAGRTSIIGVALQGANATTPLIIDFGTDAAFSVNTLEFDDVYYDNVSLRAIGEASGSVVIQHSESDGFNVIAEDFGTVQIRDSNLRGFTSFGLFGFPVIQLKNATFTFANGILSSTEVAAYIAIEQGASLTIDRCNFNFPICRLPLSDPLAFSVAFRARFSTVELQSINVLAGSVNLDGTALHVAEEVSFSGQTAVLQVNNGSLSVEGPTTLDDGAQWENKQVILTTRDAVTIQNQAIARWDSVQWTATGDVVLSASRRFLMTDSIVRMPENRLTVSNGTFLKLDNAEWDTADILVTGAATQLFGNNAHYRAVLLPGMILESGALMRLDTCVIDVDSGILSFDDALNVTNATTINAVGLVCKGTGAAAITFQTCPITLTGDLTIDNASVVLAGCRIVAADVVVAATNLVPTVQTWSNVSLTCTSSLLVSRLVQWTASQCTIDSATIAVIAGELDNCTLACTNLIADGTLIVRGGTVRTLGSIVIDAAFKKLYASSASLNVSLGSLLTVTNDGQAFLDKCAGPPLAQIVTATGGTCDMDSLSVALANVPNSASQFFPLPLANSNADYKVFLSYYDGLIVAAPLLRGRASTATDYEIGTDTTLEQVNVLIVREAVPHGP